MQHNTLELKAVQLRNHKFYPALELLMKALLHTLQLKMQATSWGMRAFTNSLRIWKLPDRKLQPWELPIRSFLGSQLPLVRGEVKAHRTGARARNVLALRTTTKNSKTKHLVVYLAPILAPWLEAHSFTKGIQGDLLDPLLTTVTTSQTLTGVITCQTDTIANTPVVPTKLRTLTSLTMVWTLPTSSGRIW
jgi:hypothetical protein